MGLVINILKYYYKILSFPFCYNHIKDTIFIYNSALKFLLTTTYLIFLYDFFVMNLDYISIQH